MVSCVLHWHPAGAAGFCWIWSGEADALPPRFPGIGFRVTTTWRLHTTPVASVPVKPSVLADPGCALRTTRFPTSVRFAGIVGAGNVAARGCAAPSIVNPVRIAGEPLRSASVTLNCQLIPCASGGFAKTVPGALTVTAAVPAGGRLTRTLCEAAPLLNAVSPE